MKKNTLTASMPRHFPEEMAEAKRASYLNFFYETMEA
jgi:hypothetical protein